MNPPRENYTSLKTWSEFIVAPDLAPSMVETVEAVVQALQGIEFVLIGGQAVFLHGYERFSKDLDIGVAVPVKDVAQRLLSEGFVRLGSARFRNPTTGVDVDVVKLPRCAIPSLKSPVLRGVGSMSAPVIDVETLMALKLKMGRLRDQADVTELLKAGCKPDRARLRNLMRALGEDLREYDRLAQRAKREVRQQADFEREQQEDDE